MDKPIKPIVFAAVVLAATASAAYIINLLDQIVHGQLYNYGLLFDLTWATPYWNLLHILQILLGVIAVATVVNMVFTIRKYVSTKKMSAKMMPSQKPVAVPQSTRPIVAPTRTVTSTQRTVEKVQTMSASPSVVQAQTPLPPLASPVPHVPQASQVPEVPTPPPTQAPAQTRFSSEIPGLIRCSHCGKAFTQPLRMLDFQGDRPRIVSICPFCNEIITAAAPRQEEESEKGKKFFFRKKNNNHMAKTLAPQ